jgi:hypothetical protein
MKPDEYVKLAVILREQLPIEITVEQSQAMVRLMLELAHYEVGNFVQVNVWLFFVIEQLGYKETMAIMQDELDDSRQMAAKDN